MQIFALYTGAKPKRAENSRGYIEVYKLQIVYKIVSYSALRASQNFKGAIPNDQETDQTIKIYRLQHFTFSKMFRSDQKEEIPPSLKLALEVMEQQQ